MKKHTYKGRFIVVEGLDGAGHTTQAKLLGQFLEKMGKKVVLTHEPTLISEAGKLIDRILQEKEKISAEELQKLFAQDRKEHLQKKVIPALKEGKIVISDRYFFSSFAYGVADGLDLNWLMDINKGFLLPDITIILKVSPEVCLARIKRRGDPRTLFERKKQLEKVWQTYEMMPNRFPNVVMVDGERPEWEVFSQISKIVLSILKKRRK